MTYIIILIAVAAVAGPLLSALPSKQQRRITRFRDAARGAGIQVRCREPNELPPRLQRATSDMLVCYAMRCGKQGSKSSSVSASSGGNSLWVRTTAGWEGRDSEALPAWLGHSSNSDRHIQPRFTSIASTAQLSAYFPCSPYEWGY